MDEGAPPVSRRSGVVVTRFGRLADTHAAMMAADAVMLVALASTVLNLDVSAARTRVLVYQLTTLAPFTVLAPYIGPLIDRIKGGRRFIVRAVAFGRIAVSIALAVALDSLWLYPLALAALILKQTYSVSKSALVPSVAFSEADLVEANAKLGVIGGVAAGLAALPAAAIQHASPEFTLIVSAVGFGVAFVFARHLPGNGYDEVDRTAPHVRAELRAPSVVVGAGAIVLLRASIGFMQFLLFFWLRRQHAGSWFAVAIAVGAVGSVCGNALGPRVRSWLREEAMVITGLAMVAVSGVACAVAGSRLAAVALMTTVNFGASLGRLGFDSIVQRDAHDAVQGRAFARFESRFQLGWVVAAIPPVIWTPPGRVGFTVVAALALFATVSYLIGLRAIRLGRPIPEPISHRVGRTIVERIETRRGAGSGGEIEAGQPEAGSIHLGRRRKRRG